jgi:uncharacterized repeat protein (TIGR01451 family)
VKHSMYQKYKRLTLLMFVLLALSGLGAGAGLAQPPQLDLALSLSPTETPIGTSLLGTLVVHNAGTEPATFDTLSLRLPGGVAYVGPALGSDLVDAPQIQEARLRWSGPFTLTAGEELAIQFWAVASSRATAGEQPAEASLLSGEQVLASAQVSLSLQPGAQDRLWPAAPASVERAPALPDAVTVAKLATPDLIRPGQPVLYTVTFANSGLAVTLDRIADLLPAPFQYVGLAPGSQVSQDPTDREGPEIVWSGRFPVPAGGTLTLRYWVWVPPETPASPLPYTNVVTARYGPTSVGPAYADVRILSARIELSKQAQPQAVTSGEGVTYTVTFTNEGTAEGVVEEIHDTLPTAFVFLGMAEGSDVMAPPAGSTGMLTWGEPLAVPAGQSRQLIYQVRAMGTGELQNEVEATTAEGESLGPASATVTVSPHRAFLPLVHLDTTPVTTLPFVEDFGRSMSPDWQVFTQPGGPLANDWFHDPVRGLYWYDPYAQAPYWEYFALSMYLGSGSQTWSNYRVIAELKDSTPLEPTAGLVGIWVRGSYDNGRVGGYYVHLRPGDNKVYLWRLKPGATDLQRDAEVVASQTYAPGIFRRTAYFYVLKVEVEGANIKAYLKYGADPDTSYVRLIDWTDPNATYPQGTVGLSGYRARAVYDSITVTPLAAGSQ